MNFLFTVLLISSITSCCSSQINKKVQGVDNTHTFLIKKIEPRNDTIFLIYATENDSLFKIVSYKGRITALCNNIQVGGSYNIKIKSLLEIDDSPGYNSPQNIAFMSQQLEGVVFHGNNILFEKEAGISNIYQALNLNGLCLSNESH